MILEFDIDDVIFKTSEIVKNNIDKSQDEELLKLNYTKTCNHC